jgi:hypothetical protein
VRSKLAVEHLDQSAPLLLDKLVQINVLQRSRLLATAMAIVRHNQQHLVNDAPQPLPARHASRRGPALVREDGPREERELTNG